MGLKAMSDVDVLHNYDFDQHRFYELINELSIAYEEMAKQCHQFKKCSMLDQEMGYECYIPTFDPDERARQSPEARNAAVQASIGLTISEVKTAPEICTGLLCASPQTVQTVEAMNEAKAAFKAVVLDIRQLHAKKISAARDGLLQMAMKSAGVGTLDLRECYRQIRIMPTQLNSFSWTWATSHSRMQRVTVEEALKMADNLRDEQAVQIVKDLLNNNCTRGEYLVRRVKQPNQMRANYAFVDNEEVVRKSCPVSGVVIAQQKHLPRLFWRPDPGKKRDSLARESIIEAEPLVKALDLYRYVDRQSA